MFLRLIGPHRSAGERGAQVVVEERGLAHRKDARLGARGVGQMGAVADGEQGVVARDAQGCVHAHEAFVQWQAGAREPRVRAGSRDAGDEGGGERVAGRKRDAVRRDGGDALTGAERNAQVVEGAEEAGAGLWAGARDRLGTLDQRDGSRRARVGQGPRHGHRQLHPRNAATDDDRIGSGPSGDGGQMRAPPYRKGAEGLGGDGMGGEAGNIRHLGRDTDVEGRHVVGQRRATGNRQRPGDRIEVRHHAVDQCGPGEARETHEVDVQLLAGVVPRDMAGEHAGIGRGRAGVDDGQPGAGKRVHAPFAQDEGMGVAAADQDEVAGEGGVGGHPPLLPHGLRRGKRSSRRCDFAGCPIVRHGKWCRARGGPCRLTARTPRRSVAPEHRGVPP